MDLILDGSWSRPGHGDVALGGSPLTLFRLTAGGRTVVERLEAGETPPTGHEPLTDRLIAAGAAHPVVTPASAPFDDVAAVIPSHGEPHGQLQSLVETLRQVVSDVVVVDDAAPVPVGPLDGARVVRLDDNVGPGGARNAGLNATSAPLLFFVDADVTVDDPARLLGLLRSHLDDPTVGLAAPRVAARTTGGPLAAFEELHSPLDLGTEPARVRPLTRVSYVPAAALLVRRDAIVDGFDTSLRFGEDVDLVWRLDAAGWRCRYEPAAVVHHRVRSDLRRWLRQRREYGTAAAPLARRHRGAVAPVRVSRWSAAAWVAAAAGHPIIGAGIAGGSTVAFSRLLGGRPDTWPLALRYAGLGNVHAGRLFAAAATRTWWPLAVAAALVSRRARRLLVLALVVPSGIDWGRRRPRLDPVRYIALRVLDDGAYGLGVWQGCIAERDLSALRPTFTR